MELDTLNFLLAIQFYSSTPLFSAEIKSLPLLKESMPYKTLLKTKDRLKYELINDSTMADEHIL